MRHVKKVLVLLVIIGAGVVGAWQWRVESDLDPHFPEDEIGAIEVRHQADAEAIELGYKAAKFDSDLIGRPVLQEKADDIESAVRLFRKSSNCLLYHAARRGLDTILNDKRLDDLSDETLATLESLDARSMRYLEIVRQTEAHCVDSNPDALARVYIDSILKAALSGDADAESCFVIGNVSPTKEVSASAEWMALLTGRYLKYAPIFTTKALERADPYVAANALYRYIEVSVIHPSAMDNMEKADPHLVWRMARLASLRALPEQRARLEYGLNEFEKLDLLSLEDINRADDWAVETYQREFADQAPIDLDSQAPCHPSLDLAP